VTGAAGLHFIHSSFGVHAEGSKPRGGTARGPAVGGHLANVYRQGFLPGGHRQQGRSKLRPL